MGTSIAARCLKWKTNMKFQKVIEKKSNKNDLLNLKTKCFHELPSSHLIYVNAEAEGWGKEKKQMFGACIQCYNSFGLTNEMTKAMVLHTFLICLLIPYSGFGMVFFFVLWTKIMDEVLLWHCWTSVFVPNDEHWEYQNSNKNLFNHQLSTKSTWSTVRDHLFNSFQEPNIRLIEKRKTITDATIKWNHIGGMEHSALYTYIMVFDRYLWKHLRIDNLLSNHKSHHGLTFSFQFFVTWNMKRANFNKFQLLNGFRDLFGCSNHFVFQRSAFSSICLLFSFLNLKSSIHDYCFISIAKCTFTLFHFQPFICATQYEVIKSVAQGTLSEQSTEINTTICIAEPFGIGVVDCSQHWTLIIKG